jgi:uncharacterized protein (DUF305 family)
VLVVLAGCSAGATAALLVTRTPGEDSAEAGFARDMMVHHAQAVQMAEIVRDKTGSDAIQLLAADVALTQQAQIGMMQGWMQVWGLSHTSTKPAMSWMGHPTEGLMPGMATPEEIDSLYDAPPEEADRLFLRLMIAHHRAAIPMAEAILERTDRSEVRQLAEAIEMSQRAEIQTMKEMLRDLLGDSAKVELKPHNGSHASGSATFTEAERGVRVELKLKGLPKSNTLYLAHIHPGTCAEGETHEHSGAHGGEEGYSHQHGESGHGHGGAEIEYPLSQVKSDSEGHGSSTTTLRETSVEKLFTGEPRHLNVHEAGSGNPPILTCADLKEAG